MFIWFVGVLETWLALWMLGEHPSIAVAVSIESLGHAVKAAGVLIPGAWGVQEGGYIALCAAFGIGSPDGDRLVAGQAHSRFPLRRPRPVGLAADGGQEARWPFCKNFWLSSAQR